MIDQNLNIIGSLGSLQGIQEEMMKCEYHRIDLPGLIQATEGENTMGHSN
jgi:hypothetical protein